MLLIWKRLNRERIAINISLSNGGVIHVCLNRITNKLTVTTPHYRVVIHSHTRVFRISNKESTYGLYIRAERPHVVDAIDFTIHLRRVHVESLHTNCVGMNEQCVTLGEVFCNRTRLSTKSNSRRVSIVKIVSLEGMFLFLVYIIDVPFPCSFASVAIISKVATSDCALV